ncbi:sensor histidine kinase [Pseudoalteromonas sp. G4]|uniref:sensor histidine kinase n=1 Tax=Pseudoalteromonas sp. G4 TaxID=2992761 RepID=UPI00237D5602|nr:HAMP domain-containing sensor histidine kinase [Pseudoalteromonas sp. G4]MDE3272018.1 HAMP domain-containing histidine kinase [Pseudoalteromonas sp. G4]
MFTLIRTRIIVSFISIALLVSTLFIGLGFIFSYEVEDGFFRFILNSEKEQVESQLATNQTVSTHYPFVSYVASIDALPQPIFSLLQEEPNRIEFSGDGDKHYHIKALSSGYLVAEVSEQLIVRKNTGGMLGFALFFVTIILLIVLLVAWLLAKRITKPIKALDQLISNTTSDTMPVGFSAQFKQDEIGVFAKALDNAFMRVRQFIEREQNFTRDASHELRTPIAISVGAVALLKETPLSQEQQVLLSRIENAQRDMQQSVSGLLAMAREHDYELSDIKLLPLIEQAILLHHKLIENKPIEIEVNVDSTATVNTNHDAFKMVLSNLISNAFHHTNKGTIFIEYAKNHLTIRDSGSGIDKQLLNKVFDAGVKSDSSTGLGFGLAIVKRLCKRLAIDITVSSDKQGTVFTLKLASD